MELAKSGSNTASKRWTLIAMILASGIVFLDGTVVNVALPSIDRELNAGLSGLQWIVDGYALTLSAFLILGGAIGDQYGRRRTMLGGLAGFGIASAACGLVTGPEWLVLARLVQGIAGAFLVPGSLAVITAVFNDNSEEQGKAIGTWAGWSGITTVIGPLLGGWLVDNLSWRWIFFINVPFVAVTFWLILSRVPETSDRKAGRKLDWMGAVLAVIGLGGTIFGLIEGPVAGWNQTGIVLALVIGVLALIAFVIVEFRVPDPMMPPRLFRIRNFTGVNLATFGVYFALAGMSFFVTIYVQSIMGYPAFFAGLAFFPISVIMLLFSSRAGRLAGKYGGRIFMTVGPLIYAAGMLLFLRLQPGSNLWLEVVPAVLVIGLGMVITVAPLTGTVMGSVPPENAGSASAVNNVVSRVAGLLAIAGLGVVMSAVFTGQVAEQAQKLDAATAASLHNAAKDPSSALNNLTGGFSPTVINAIKEAYTPAFHWVIIVCALMAALGGLISFIMIRRSANQSNIGAKEKNQPAA